MPNKKQKYIKDNKSFEIAELEFEVQILEKALQGKQPTVIAKELRCGINTVHDVIDKWIAAYNAHLEAQAELLQVSEIAKLDYLYEQVLPHALARRDEVSGVILPPDYRLLNVIVRIMAEKREWLKMREEARLRAQANQSASEQRIVQTLSGGSELFKTALININDDWLKAADASIEDLYKDRVDVDVDIDEEIKKRVKDDE